MPSCNEVVRVRVTCPDETVPVWVFLLQIVQQLSLLMNCPKGSSYSQLLLRFVTAEGNSLPGRVTNNQGFF